MKLNLPVTQTECYLEAGKPIVTKTDLEGRIVYANESFVRISGYTREELLGQNHHIVRHPDMPAQAFADLWRTIARGQPWRGLVKNRCKNGDFYWVEAYVTPVLEQGKVVGYMSVRNTPSREQVEQAMQLYAEVRENRRPFPKTPRGEAAVGLLGIYALFGALVSLAAGLGAAFPGLAAGMAGLSLLLCLAMGAYLWRSVAVPVRAVSTALRALEEGALQTPIQVAGGGQLRAVLTQVESLRIHMRSTFCDVLLSSQDVEGGAISLNTKLRVMNEHSEAQAERVMQVAAAMEEMSVAVSEISEHTRRSMQTSESARKAVDSNGAQIEQTLASSARVIETVRNTESRLLDLSRAIGEIGNITQSIRKVADRTNMLALNAAIEAARAGEEGRGFAVVAEEVRRLAEQAAASTQEIEATVSSISALTLSAEESMHQAVDEIGQSNRTIASASAGLSQIRHSADEVVSSSREIADMLKQQSAASHEVAANMEKISEAIDRTRHELSGADATSGELRHTATQLRDLVRHLEHALA